MVRAISGRYSPSPQLMGAGAESLCWRITSHIGAVSPAATKERGSIKLLAVRSFLSGKHNIVPLAQVILKKSLVSLMRLPQTWRWDPSKKPR